MAKKNNVKLVFKRTAPVAKAAIMAAVVLSLIALIALYGAIARVREQYDALRNEAIELESGNTKLEDRIGALGTLESALRIAMEELGLAFPDSVIFTPGN